MVGSHDRIGLPAVWLISAAVVAACTSSPSSTSSPVASDTAPTALDCGAVSLGAPDGEPVFLGGTWIGSGDPDALPVPSVFYLRQTNECLVWVGLSAENGEAPGSSWIETFTGRIGSDFAVTGEWEDVPEGGSGTITVAIEFVPVGDRYEVELVLGDSSGDTHLTKRWVRQEASQ